MSGRWHRAVYFAATGGAEALISKTFKRTTVLSYADLGTEAIRRLEVQELPAIVVGDARGNDLYRAGRLNYLRA